MFIERCKERQNILKMFYNLIKLKKLLVMAFVLVFVNFSVFSEFSVALYKIDAKDINKQTNIAINNAIFTFINELKNYKILDRRDELFPKNKKAQNDIFDKYDYVFTGKLLGLKDGIKLELILIDSSNDVTRTIHKVYRNSNLILLDSRVLVSSLFDMSLNLVSSDKGLKNKIAEKIDKEFLPITDLANLSGTWKGDKGVERIEIMRGGRAMAVLSSGVLIRLSISIDAGYLYVKQLSAPLARQFMGLPDAVAKKTARLGKTPTWRLKISQDNKTLSGIKTDIQVIHDEMNIISSDLVEKLVTWHRQQ